ncbi:MAG: hypothetical protein ACE5OZ_16595 [Candidatus Heimdallarchaeota archaeon]
MSMTKKNRKSKMNKPQAEIFDLESLESPRVVLKAYVQTLSAIKTLNEAVQNGTYMMKLKPTAVFIEYQGKDNKTKKRTKKTRTIYLETYQVKGLKGLVRHLLMELLDALGISGCHSTNRISFGKEERLTIPSDSNVHPLGACVKGKDKTRKDGCLTYQIFGAMLEQSIIKFGPILIAQANGNKLPASATVIQPKRKVFFVHAATEARNVMTIEHKPIQEFREGYFDGDFILRIDVTQCRPEQIGALAEALFRAEELGGGKTAGYGQIAIDLVELCAIEEKRHIESTEHGLEKRVTKKEQNLGAKLQEAYAAWGAYKEAHRTICKEELTGVPAIT